MKEHIEGYCTFNHYKDNQLWYITQNTNLLFPVPIEDIGGAIFGQSEKGILMMRYIRKWLAEISS